MEIIFLIIGVIFGVVSASFFANSRIKGETGRVEERSILLEKEKVNLENNLDSERQKVIELSSKLFSTSIRLLKIFNKNSQNKNQKLKNFKRNSQSSLKISLTEYLKLREINSLKRIRKS